MRQPGRFPCSLLLIIVFVVMSVLAGAGQTDKTAEKVAPRDATGDLGNVKGSGNSSTPVPTPQPTEPVTVPSPTPTPHEVISEVQIMTIPSVKQPTRESDETGQARSIINDPEVKRLLKHPPDFIYNPAELKDPMIVPWIRNTILVKEFVQNLQKLIRERRFENAKSLINQIRELLPEVTEPVVSKDAEIQIALANQEIMKTGSSTTTEGPGLTGAPPIETPVITMPSWIETHVGGVIWQPKAEERTVLIGDDILKEGDKIPRYPDAVVQKINDKSVVVSYRGLVKEIIVIPGGKTGSGNPPGM